MQYIQHVNVMHLPHYYNTNPCVFPLFSHISSTKFTTFPRNYQIFGDFFCEVFHIVSHPIFVVIILSLNNHFLLNFFVGNHSFCLQIYHISTKLPKKMRFFSLFEMGDFGWKTNFFKGNVNQIRGNSQRKQGFMTSSFQPTFWWNALYNAL